MPEMAVARLSTRPSSTSLLLKFVPISLSLLFCATRFLWITWRYSVNVFIGDQWDYHEPTLFHRQPASLIFFWENSPWRQGLGGVLSAWLEPLFRWNSRYESFVAAGLILAACLLALWLKVRVAGSLGPWDFLIPLFVLTPVQYETIVGVTHLSHGPLPLLLLIGFCLAWTIPKARWRYPSLLILDFFSTYTGFGVFVGVLCPAAICWEVRARRGQMKPQERRLAMAAFLLSLVILSLYFVGYTFSGGTCAPNEGLHTRNPLHYFLFVAFMFANFAGWKAPLALVPAVLLGSALAAFVLAMFIYAICRARQLMVPALLIGYSLLFAGAAAWGRMCLGLAAAIGSRYMIYLVPAFLGIYLMADAIGNRARRAGLLSVLAVAALLSSAIVHQQDRADMAAISRLRVAWRSCYLAHHDLAGCNRQTGATKYSYPGTIQAKIDFLEQRRLNLFSDDTR